MKKETTIAIAGATGVIGSEILAVINDLKLNNLTEVRLYASERSAGELYNALGDEVEVQLLKDADFKGVDVVILALPDSLVETYAKKALDAGSVVIDTSSVYRMKEQATLVVPAINIDSITKDTKLIACANACVIQLAPLFDVIKRQVGIKRSVVTALEPVASAGKFALDELWDQTRSIFSQTEVESDVFPHQIAFNCIPQVGTVLENGYTSEEEAIKQEIIRLLNGENLLISVTAVRLPVFHGSSLVVNVETEEKIVLSDLYSELEKISGMEVIKSYDEYPMPLSVAVTGDNAIARVRQATENILDLWLSADGIRACVAHNVVRILQQVLSVQE